MKVADIDLAMELVQYLDEPAHVRALEAVRQVHVHVQRGDGVLLFFRLVAQGNRIRNGFDADFSYVNPAMVDLVLGVFHGGKFSETAAGHKMGPLAFNTPRVFRTTLIRRFRDFQCSGP